MHIHEESTHFYGRWTTSGSGPSASLPHYTQLQDRSAALSLLYPTTPSLYPTPLSQGRSWAPSGLNDEIYATTTRERHSEAEGHQERLLRFLHQSGQSGHQSATRPTHYPQQSSHLLPFPALERRQPSIPLAEKSPGVVMHELLADLDGNSIDELYCMFVRPGVRLAGAEDDGLHPATDLRGNSISPSSGRAVSVAVSDDDPHHTGLTPIDSTTTTRMSHSSAMPSLVSARIVTEVEDAFMDHPTSPVVAVTTHEQPPPLPEYEQRRRITLEDHEREARLDLLQFEVRQRTIAKHLSASV
ncbi:Hypothetical protein, putative [Bodo saltans]|uniref:Uncharacterized protein n=1 Tax=Bodo saltans TaxID=75058 RepID=A0A0S4JVM3_BODSA|nr:Hypothetical protein, putative [Bodo saltans]|eukprot:CUG94096.1 Hypothetical protein, putative [Bodo saltans]